MQSGTAYTVMYRGLNWANTNNFFNLNMPKVWFFALWKLKCFYQEKNILERCRFEFQIKVSTIISDDNKLPA